MTHYLPHKMSDEYFNCKILSIKTCPLHSVSRNTSLIVLKRFDCGMYTMSYDDTVTPNRHVLRIDPLSHCKNRLSINVNQYVDDLKSCKIISNGGDKVKSACK